MAFDTSPFSTSVTVTGEPTINVEKPGLFGLATAAPLRTGFTTPLIPGSTAQAPTGDSPVIQALKKRNVIDDGGDSDLPPSWTPPIGHPSNLFRGEPVTLGKDTPSELGGWLGDQFTSKVIDPVVDVFEGASNILGAKNPLEAAWAKGGEFVDTTLTDIEENPFSWAFRGAATIAGLVTGFKPAGMIAEGIISLFGGNDKEYFQGIQHGLFSPTAPAQGVGGPGDESMMGVYGLDHKGDWGFLGTQLEVGQRRAEGKTDDGKQWRGQGSAFGQDYGTWDVHAGAVRAAKEIGKYDYYNQAKGPLPQSGPIPPSPSKVPSRAGWDGPSPSDIYDPYGDVNASAVRRAEQIQRSFIDPMVDPSNIPDSYADINIGAVETAEQLQGSFLDTRADQVYSGGFQDPGDISTEGGGISGEAHSESDPGEMADDW